MITDTRPEVQVPPNPTALLDGVVEPPEGAQRRSLTEVFRDIEWAQLGDRVIGVLSGVGAALGIAALYLIGTR